MTVTPLRVARRRPGRDLAAAERAAAAFLDALGVDRAAEGLAETPARMARAYAELLTPREFRATTFPNDEGYDELVLARAIPSGYLSARILGLSTVLAGFARKLAKRARLVEHFAHGPQVQERLTKQIADWLTDHLHPGGVGVIIEAEHLCMTLRGVRAVGAKTITSTLLGTLREDARSRAEFFALTGVATTA